MKRVKIVNVSDVKLEFFIKKNNYEDKLISLNPGFVCFSDGEELTKSIKIFHRKNLLTIELGDFEIIDLSDNNISKTASTIPTEDWATDNILLPETSEHEPSHIDILKTAFNLDILIEAEKQAKEYVEDETETEKKQYKYKYKKKPGRKKKRGPKPGLKKKKLKEEKKQNSVNNSSENNNQ